MQNQLKIIFMILEDYLEKNWKIKKLSNLVSNELIDRIYTMGIKNGAREKFSEQEVSFILFVFHLKKMINL